MTAGCGSHDRRVAGWTALVLFGPGLASLAAADGARLASTAAAVEQQLREPVSVFWSGDPLRRAVTLLCAGQRVGVLIDRRVDPDQGLVLRAVGVPLKQVLERIAEERQLGVAVLGPVVYLGPPDAAASLRALAQSRAGEAKRLPAAAARTFLQPGALRWDDFATPRGLLAGLAAESGIALAGLEQVPHDLWAAADLPPLSLVDRLTLIAIQFDLTFDISTDGTTATLAPLPDGLETGPLDRPAAKRVPDRRAKSATRPVPGKRAAGPAEIRFTQKPTRGPVGVLLEQLAERLGLELRVDRQAIEAGGLSLDKTVSFSVENATMDELLDAVLSPAGLAHRRSGKILEVFPAR